MILGPRCLVGESSHLGHLQAPELVAMEVVELSEELPKLEVIIRRPELSTTEDPASEGLELPDLLSHEQLNQLVVPSIISDSLHNRVRSNQQELGEKNLGS